MVAPEQLDGVLDEGSGAMSSTAGGRSVIPSKTEKHRTRHLENGEKIKNKGKERKKPEESKKS